MSFAVKNNHNEKIDREKFLLYGITGGYCGMIPLDVQVKAAIKGGCRIIQLRDKSNDEDQIAATASELLKITRPLGALLIVNDSVYAARKSGADGVHLGQSDGSPKKAREILGTAAIIGVTAKTIEQAEEAECCGADYLGCGSVFASPTKPGAIAISLKDLTNICLAVRIPVCAIGGITSENAAALAGTGISGLAAVSAVFSGIFEQDIYSNAVKMRKAAELVCVRGDK